MRMEGLVSCEVKWHVRRSALAKRKAHAFFESKLPLFSGCFHFLVKDGGALAKRSASFKRKV
jgi:hypothetical protein